MDADLARSPLSKSRCAFNFDLPSILSTEMEELGHQYEIFDPGGASNDHIFAHIRGREIFYRIHLHQWIFAHLSTEMCASIVLEILLLRGVSKPFDRGKRLKTVRKFMVIYREKVLVPSSKPCISLKEWEQQRRDLEKEKNHPFSSGFASIKGKHSCPNFKSNVLDKMLEKEIAGRISFMLPVVEVPNVTKAVQFLYIIFGTNLEITQLNGILHIGQSCRRLKSWLLEWNSIDENVGKCLHKLALNKMIFEALNFYMTDLGKISFENLELMARNCCSLVSVTVSDCEIIFRTENALEEFCGASFNEHPDKYSSVVFTQELCHSGLTGMGKIKMPFVFPSTPQLRKLNLLYALLNTEDPCRSLQRSSSLEIFNTNLAPQVLDCLPLNVVFKPLIEEGIRGLISKVC